MLIQLAPVRSTVRSIAKFAQILGDRVLHDIHGQPGNRDADGVEWHSSAGPGHLVRCRNQLTTFTLNTPFRQRR